MANKNPKVYIPDHEYGEGSYVIGKKRWQMSTLQEAVKHLPVFDLQLAAIDLSSTAWDVSNIAVYMYHHKRVEKANLKYPVILDPTGYVIDGWHRIVKAILKGKTEIKAVKLNVMPEPDVISE